MRRDLTWLAVAVTFVLTIPGLAVGYFVGALYSDWFEWMFKGNLLDLVTKGWATTIVAGYGGDLVAGAIGGSIAIGLCSKIIKAANYHVVAYSISSIVVVLALVFTGIGAVHAVHIGLGIVSPWFNTLGLIMALFVVAHEIPGVAAAHPDSESSASTG